MQPYFFPYLGYFSLIKNTELFVLLDTVQFIRHGWIERNRILKPGTDWQYISVPLKKHSRETLIKETEINNETNWEEKILAQLGHYKKSAPYYYKVINMLNGVFSKPYTSIVELNKDSLKAVCDFLEIKCTISVFSEMNLDLEKINAPDEWALNICKAIGGVDEYWNPKGGMAFFDINKYLTNNINVNFIDQNLKYYNQKRENFEPGLSIIDVMMFNSPEEIRLMLNEFDII